jgi:hypothetical protein
MSVPARLDQHPTGLRRIPASDYLREVWGIELAPTTMASGACRGRNVPPHRVVAGKSLYVTSELDAWARRQLGIEAVEGA